MAITKIAYEKGDYFPLPPKLCDFSLVSGAGYSPVDKVDQRGISKSNAKERLRAKKEAGTRKRRGGTSFGGNVKPAQNITVSFFNAIAYF